MSIRAGLPGVAHLKVAVVLVHGQGEAYEVEFVALDGHTQAVLTLPAAEITAPHQPLKQVG